MSSSEFLSLGLEPVSQDLDLVLQVPDHDVLRVRLHVDHGPVVDELGVVGVLEGALALAVVAVRRGQTGDHHGAGVAAQGILRQKETHEAFG